MENKIRFKTFNEIINNIFDNWDVGYDSKSNLKDLMANGFRDYGNQVIEECAKICEDHCLGSFNHDDHDCEHSIAEDLRKLKNSIH